MKTLRKKKKKTLNENYVAGKSMIMIRIKNAVIQVVVDHSGRFIRKEWLEKPESFLTPMDEEIANVDSVEGSK